MRCRDRFTPDSGGDKAQMMRGCGDARGGVRAVLPCVLSKAHTSPRVLVCQPDFFSRGVAESAEGGRLDFLSVNLCSPLLHNMGCDSGGRGRTARSRRNHPHSWPRAVGDAPEGGVPLLLVGGAHGLGAISSALRRSSSAESGSSCPSFTITRGCPSEWRPSARRLPTVVGR